MTATKTLALALASIPAFILLSGGWGLSHAAELRTRAAQLDDGTLGAG